MESRISVPKVVLLQQQLPKLQPLLFALLQTLLKLLALLQLFLLRLGVPTWIDVSLNVYALHVVSTLQAPLRRHRGFCYHSLPL